MNTSSGAASAFVKTQDAPTKALFSGEGLTMDTLEVRVRLRLRLRLRARVRVRVSLGLG